MKIFFTATAESVYNLGNMWYHWQLVSVTECGAGWPDRLAWTGHTQFEGTAPTTHLIHKLILRYKLQGKWTQGVHKVQLFLLLFQLPGNCRLWAINLQLSTPRTQGLLNTDRKVQLCWNMTWYVDTNVLVCQAAVLRETVRQECEERYELTEALEVAKKELLLLKRPPSRHGLFDV